MPNTDKFREDLRRKLQGLEQSEELTIPVKFDPDLDDLRAKLAQLDNSRITIPVDLELGPDQVAQLRAQLAGLTGVTIPVNLDLDTAQLAQLNSQLASLRNRTVNIRIRLHGLSQALAQLTALDAIVRRLDGLTINIQVDIDGLAAALAQLAALLAAVTALNGLRINLGGALFGGLGGVAAVIGRVVVGLLQLSAVAFAVAVAGAAITAAWGAASTAIAAINPAVALLAAPLAAVMLGLDGIKNAAASIAPAFDKMKASVAATFERGMLPVFKQLATVFPQLTTSMNGVAAAMSGAALQLAKFVTFPGVFAQIQTAIDRASGALTAMVPGIQDVIAGFVQMSTLQSGFDALTGAVTTFGREFKLSVQNLVADGTMTRAFQGLQAVLESLARGFVNLVENGIRVFAAAAPGVTALLDSLTNFFGRFDWNALGAAVGNVFRGLAETINAIPQGTIDGITQAFQRLGATFRDAAFQLRDSDGHRSPDQPCRVLRPGWVRRRRVRQRHARRRQEFGHRLPCPDHRHLRHRLVRGDAVLLGG
jgi:hypothetical protein